MEYAIFEDYQIAEAKLKKTWGFVFPKEDDF